MAEVTRNSVPPEGDRRGIAPEGDRRGNAPEGDRRNISPEDVQLAEIFRELDDGELRKLSRWFNELRVPADHYIVQAGERSQALYVILEGGVAVFRDTVGEPVQLLANLGRGEFFGEIGLFGIGQPTASVRTTEPSRLIRIFKRDLLAFLDRHAAIKRKLLATASYRYSSHVAAALELARRHEVRIGFRYDVVLELADGGRTPAALLNLSLGGLSLDTAPSEWQVGARVHFSLGLPNGKIELWGLVTWRRGERVGVAFERTHPNHNLLLQLTIRMLLETTPGL